jgi:hypothetical protein
VLLGAGVGGERGRVFLGRIRAGGCGPTLVGARRPAPPRSMVRVPGLVTRWRTSIPSICDVDLRPGPRRVAVAHVRAERGEQGEDLQGGGLADVIHHLGGVAQCEVGPARVRSGENARWKSRPAARPDSSRIGTTRSVPVWSRSERCWRKRALDTSPSPMQKGGR